MVFRILSEPRYDQTFGVGFSGTAVSNEKKIRLTAADELRSPRQTFPIRSCPPVPCELFRRSAAKALIERRAVTIFLLSLHKIAQFTTHQLPAQLQHLRHIDVDLNAVGLTLAGGLAEVVGGKCKMRFPDLKGIIQTFHKAVTCIDANDLATVAVIIHG